MLLDLYMAICTGVGILVTTYGIVLVMDKMFKRVMRWLNALLNK